MNPELTAKIIALRLKNGDENLVRMFTIANEQGIHNAVATFSGGGDSGDIDDITYLPNYPTEELQSLVTDYAHKECAEIPTDWWNNNGGRGAMKIDFQTGDVLINVEYMDYVEGEGAEFNIFN